MKSSSDFDRLWFQTSLAVQFFANYCEDENPRGSKGGVLLYVDENNIEHHAMVGGTVTDYGTCLKSARTRIFQLNLYPDHVSSYQSRDPHHGFWGGGCRFHDGRASVAGLHEKANEACLLNGLSFEGFLLLAEVYEILAFSKNRVLFERIQAGLR